MLTLEQLTTLAQSAPQALQARVAQFRIAGQMFHFGTQPYLMGVINLSPDSWYRESVSLSAPAAIRRAQILHAEGADLIDIGAESTLPHAARADAGAQTSRLLPVVQALAEQRIPCSVETYNPDVTEACLGAGAAVLNLTGNVGSEAIYQRVAAHNAAVIICFVLGDNVREAAEFDLRGDPIEQIYSYFARQVELAARCGVSRILIDPGLGFYYRNLQDGRLRVAHQMRVFLSTFRLRALGFPVCHALPHAFEFFEHEVRCAEPFFAVLAALGKTDLFRTHEVARTRAVLQTLGAWPDAVPKTA